MNISRSPQLVIAVELGVRETSTGVVNISEVELDDELPGLVEGQVVSLKGEDGLLRTAVVEVSTVDQLGKRYLLRIAE